MAEARSLKLPDSKRAYLASVTHANTMQAQTVSRVENALTDTPGRGRTSEISDEEKARVTDSLPRVTDAACRNPTDFGNAAEIWTHAQLMSLLNWYLTASFPRE